MTTGRRDFNQQTITTADVIGDTKVSVTATAASHVLDTATKALKIYNAGPNVVYHVFDDAATTDSFPLKPGTAGTDDVRGGYISFVCATGKTSTVYVREYG